MLQRAKKKVEQRDFQVAFLKADAHQLPFGDSTYDGVISEYTVCILKKDAAIGEMVRVVKPNGYVGIHDIYWQENSGKRLKRRLSEIEGEEPETLEGWHMSFEKVGLVDVKSIDK